MKFDIEQERARFEQAAMAKFTTRRQAGDKVIDDNGCEITPESLFWKDEHGNYGVKMFNPAWWGWKEACEAMVSGASVVVEPSAIETVATARVPTEVVDLYKFMLVAFVPQTPQQEEIHKQLLIAEKAIDKLKGTTKWISSAMNATHEQHSPTHMGEPLLHNAGDKL